MWPELESWLRTLDADVICLQEVTRTAGLGGWTEFADAERTLPQRADLFGDVVRLLPGHQGQFVTCDAGPVTDADGRTHVQDFGLATFVADRLPVVGVEVAFVHGAYVEHETWAASERPRLAQAVRVVDRPGERLVTVIHLHGLRDAAGKGDTPARRAQAERLAELVERNRAAGGFTVVAGDLNLLPDAETFAILGRVGLVDLVGAADTRTSHYAKPVRHASYLLVSDAAAVRRFEVVTDPEVSDHRPLLLEI
jgi:endonuclease/exonuclease/phosphatase family metal-dependent hydrolase